MLMTIVTVWTIWILEWILNDCTIWIGISYQTFNKAVTFCVYRKIYELKVLFYIFFCTNLKPQYLAKAESVQQTLFKHNLFWVRYQTFKNDLAHLNARILGNFHLKLNEKRDFSLEFLGLREHSECPFIQWLFTQCIGTKN